MQSNCKLDGPWLRSLKQMFQRNMLDKETAHSSIIIQTVEQMIEFAFRTPEIDDRGDKTNFCQEWKARDTWTRTLLSDGYEVYDNQIYIRCN